MGVSPPFSRLILRNPHRSRPTTPNVVRTLRRQVRLSPYIGEMACQNKHTCSTTDISKSAKPSGGLRARKKATPAVKPAASKKGGTSIPAAKAKPKAKLKATAQRPASPTQPQDDAEDGVGDVPGPEKEVVKSGETAGGTGSDTEVNAGTDGNASDASIVELIT